MSYNADDRAVVRDLAERLLAVGVQPWLDVWSLVAGQVWHQQAGAAMDTVAACAVFIGPCDLGAWEREELAIALDRAVADRSFRVFPVLLPGLDDPIDPNCLPHFLRTRPWVDLRAGVDGQAGLRDLVCAIRGEPIGPSLAERRGDDAAPYCGLRPFEEADAPYFFGREGDTQRLIEKLKASSFVAVLGRSGSGKSSLVNAGLLPALRAGALADIRDWRVIAVRPGAAPLVALAAQLAALRPDSAMHATLHELAHDPRTLYLAVELALGNTPTRVLVFIDQLEEVFVPGSDEEQARQLFANLIEATARTRGRIAVVVTLRTDFYAHCASYPAFAQLIASEQILLGIMSREDLHRVIELPARRAELTLENGLADTILVDAGQEPGSLPLLEQALFELWERRQRNVLTLHSYRQSGGVHGAIAQRADGIFGDLDPERQELARELFLRLTRPGDGTEDTRRRVEYGELHTGEVREGLDDVLTRLVDARLLTTGQDERGVAVIDIAHEALIRGWPRLREWLDADREGHRIHSRLADAAREWDADERDPAVLYRGARLAAAAEWAREHSPALSANERAFLNASGEQAQRARAVARRQLRRLRVLVAALAGVAVAAVIAGFFAYDQQRQADDATRRAISRQLAAESTTLLQRDPDAGLLVALEAYRLEPTHEARSSLLEAIRHARHLVRTLWGKDPCQPPAACVGAIAYSADGGRIAAADHGDVRVWNADNGGLVAVLQGSKSEIQSVAFTPDGSTVVAGGLGGVRIWNIARPESPRVIDRRLTVWSVAVSPDGRTLIYGANHGHVVLRRMGALDRAERLEHGDATSPQPLHLAISRDGRMLATSASDRVKIWDIRRRRLMGVVRIGPFGGRVAFSPGAGRLAVVETDFVRIIDLATYTEVAAIRDRTFVNDVAFSPDGALIATTNEDREVRIWSANTLRPRGSPLAGHSRAPEVVVFAPDSPRRLASASDGVRLWTLDTTELRGVLRPDTGGTVSDLAFSHDGRLLAVPSLLSSRIWDARGRKPLTELPSSEIISDVAFMPARREVASIDSSGVLRVLDLRGRTQRSVNHVPQWPLSRIDVSATLVAVSAKKSTRIFARDTLQYQGELPDSNTVRDLAFNGAGTVLAIASLDGIRFWDPAARKHIGSFGGHVPTGVAFSRDDRVLASSNADGTVRLWNAHTRRALGGPMRGHLGAVNDVAISPDARTVASAGEDGTVRLWDVAAGRQLGPVLRRSDSTSEAVAFSPDGKTLASGGTGLNVPLWDSLLWSSDLPLLQRRACRMVNRSLSRDEWRELIGTQPYRTSC